MNDKKFSITKEVANGCIRLTMKGRINSVNVDELQFMLEEVIEGEETSIVLNMFLVEYLNSSGIRVILKAFKDAKKAGRRLGIEKPSQNVRNVLGMVVLDELLVK